MFGFCLKKAFFDAWDNLFLLVLLNVASLALLLAALLLPGLLAPAWARLLLLGLLVLAGSAWFGGLTWFLKEAADFGTPSLRGLPAALRAAFLPSLQLGGLGLALGAFLSVGLPFYLARGGLLGSLAAGLLFWCAVVLVLAAQYYLPLRARLGGGFRKNARKCLVLFFDNPGFSLALGLWNLVCALLSVLTAGLAPGAAGIALNLDVALRLRLYKYDWIEAHPGADKRRLPWDELLAEDRELLGPRSLKGMIFPWKE